LRIEHLYQAYGERVVLQDFSLELPDSGTVCLFGLSGCGKTTLLNCLAGILTPSDGTITGLSEKRISYVFQESRLLPWATVQENVELVLPPDHTQAAREWISCVGLLPYAGQYPRELSGGQRQRVSFARALAYGGDVFLLDEPFHALDQAAAQEMAALLQQSFPESLKILVTHNREEAEQLSDRIYFLEGPPLHVVSCLERKVQ
jgi:NitT/TauT family transport system ATP-binding protein